jgi:hypothetical protein
VSTRHNPVPVTDGYSHLTGGIVCSYRAFHPSHPHSSQPPLTGEKSPQIDTRQPVTPYGGTTTWRRVPRTSEPELAWINEAGQ